MGGPCWPTGATGPQGRPAGGKHDNTGERHCKAVGAKLVTNDNAIVRIAREIRHAVNGWPHSAAVDALAVERAEVLVVWEDLRDQARNEGDAVTLSPAFRVM